MIVQKIQNAHKGYVLVQATIVKEKRIVIMQLKIVYLDNVLIYAIAMVYVVVKAMTTALRISIVKLEGANIVNSVGIRMLVQTAMRLNNVNMTWIAVMVSFVTIVFVPNVDTIFNVLLVNIVMTKAPAVEG